MKRINIAANTPYDDALAYSRVVATQNYAWVSATGPFDGNGKIIHEQNAYLQTLQCIQNIETALNKAGFELTDIVRTRIYVRSFDYKIDILKGHSQKFHNIRPACGVIAVADFAEAEMLVYIEAEAFKPSST